MKIRSIHIRSFRSIENSAITECGNMNVLIGKNNAGKSNLLTAIELLHKHLKGGAIAGPWPTSRPVDEFTDRDTRKTVQIAIEFELPQGTNDLLRQKLQTEAPHLEQSIEQLRSHRTLTVVLAGFLSGQSPFLFIQQMGAGTVKANQREIDIEGIRLLTVPSNVGKELFMFRQESTLLRNDLRILDRAQNERLEGILENLDNRYYWEATLGARAEGQPIRPELLRQLILTGRSSANAEDLRIGISQMASDLREKIDALEHRETEGSMNTFAGASKATPNYAVWIMKELAAARILHLRETREPIGREEAEALLNLKVTRGGPSRLQSVQTIIRSLLGVEVDAFQPESHRRGAEMDVDSFLVEANGAGIREALRLILDAELKDPQLILLEEPEAHLHPGLESAVYTFLREKSPLIQMFVTTHSTNFVDSVSFQNMGLQQNLW